MCFLKLHPTRDVCSVNFDYTEHTLHADLFINDSYIGTVSGAFKDILNPDNWCKKFGYALVGQISKKQLETIKNNFYLNLKNIRTYIPKLYALIPNSLTHSKDFRLHRELISVYSYNGYNYHILRDELLSIFNKCKKSRMKDAYGEIFYYFAVLDLLSAKTTYYKQVPYIQQSLNRGYELATDLTKNQGVV